MWSCRTKPKDNYVCYVHVVRARSVSDGWGLPVAHAPGSDGGRFCQSPERERRVGAPRRLRSGLLTVGVSVRARSVSDGWGLPVAYPPGF